MWFKNLLVYRLTQGLAVDAAALEEALKTKKARMRPAKSSTQPRKARTWCALKFRWAPVLAF